MKSKKLMKKSIALLLILVIALGIAGCGDTQAPKEEGGQGKYTAGTYTASGKGMGGDVTVSVTVDSDKITAIEVTEHDETPGISDPAIADIPNKIIEAQSTEIDGVAGATMTSNAIKEAVNSALEEASGK